MTCQELYNIFENDHIKVEVPTDIAFIKTIEHINFEWVGDSQIYITHLKSMNNLKWLNILYINNINRMRYELKLSKADENEKIGVILPAEHGGGKMIKIWIKDEKEGIDVSQEIEDGEDKIDLKKVPLTEDKFNEHIETVHGKIQQNGVFRISIMLVIYEYGEVTHIDNDNISASKIPEWTRVQCVKEEDNTGDMVIAVKYLVPCLLDDGNLCDIKKCQRVHSSTSELMRNNRRHIKALSVPTIVKNISKRAEIIIKILLADSVEHYDLWLHITDTKVTLEGNVWPFEFADVNCEIASLGGPQGWMVTNSTTEECDILKKKLDIVDSMEEAVQSLKVLKPSNSLNVKHIERKYKFNKASSCQVIYSAVKQQDRDVSHMKLPSDISFYATHNLAPGIYPESTYQCALQLEHLIMQHLKEDETATTNTIKESLDVHPLPIEDSSNITTRAMLSYRASQWYTLEVHSLVIQRLTNKLRSYNLNMILPVPELWYHVIIDITRSKSRYKWVTERTAYEKTMIEYDPIVTHVTSSENHVMVIGPNDEAKLPMQEDTEVEENNIKVRQVPLFKFFAESASKVITKFSDQSTVFVETSNMSG